MAYSITFLEEPGKKPRIFTVNLERIGFEVAPYYMYVIELDLEQQYMLSIDQSTTSTGIALTNLDASFKLVMTIPIDDKSPDRKDRYFSVLEEFLDGMCRNIFCKFIGNEEVPKISGRYRTDKVLREFKGALSLVLKKTNAYKQLEDPQYYFEEHPNSWKSTVYNKTLKRGRGAFNDKRVIASDICGIWPSLLPYLEALDKIPRSQHDYDGFDAVGILYHIRTARFTSDWMLVNGKNLFQAGTFTVLYRYLSPSEFNTDIFFSGLLEVIKAGGLEERKWNDNYSIYKNLISAANTKKLVLMTCPNASHIVSVLTEFNLPLKEDGILYCFVFSNSAVKYKAEALWNDGCKKYYKAVL